MGFADPQSSVLFFFFADSGAGISRGSFPRSFVDEESAFVVVFRGARKAMASPGAYATPLRENQVGLFGDGAAQPPTPNTNVRVLIAQKEKVGVPRRSREMFGERTLRRIRAFFISLERTLLLAFFSTRAETRRAP
jgi:hypothetical protein